MRPPTGAWSAVRAFAEAVQQGMTALQTAIGRELTTSEREAMERLRSRADELVEYISESEECETP